MESRHGSMPPGMRPATPYEMPPRPQTSQGRPAILPPYIPCNRCNKHLPNGNDKAVMCHNPPCRRIFCWSCVQSHMGQINQGVCPQCTKKNIIIIEFEEPSPTKYDQREVVSYLHRCLMGRSKPGANAYDPLTSQLFTIEDTARAMNRFVIKQQNLRIIRQTKIIMSLQRTGQAAKVLKRKYEELSQEHKVSEQKILSLANENQQLQNALAEKDGIIAQKNTMIVKFRKQFEDRAIQSPRGGGSYRSGHHSYANNGSRMQPPASSHSMGPPRQRNNFHHPHSQRMSTSSHHSGISGGHSMAGGSFTANSHHPSFQGDNMSEMGEPGEYFPDHASVFGEQSVGGGSTGSINPKGIRLNIDSASSFNQFSNLNKSKRSRTSSMVGGHFSGGKYGQRRSYSQHQPRYD